jgi:hypothetical protein
MEDLTSVIFGAFRSVSTSVVVVVVVVVVKIREGFLEGP